MPYDVPLYKERSIFVAKNKVAKPKVFIPAFPGTNCEVDSARAFEKAGAKANILVVNNLSSSAINETIDKMVEEIESSQIIMLPGGFHAVTNLKAQASLLLQHLEILRLKRLLQSFLTTVTA